MEGLRATLRRQGHRRILLFAVPLALLGLALVLLWSWAIGPTTPPLASSPATSSRRATAPASTTGGAVTGAPTTSTLVRAPAGDPARVQIPAIKVDARLLPVGLEPNGQMQVPPFGSAGWYRLGPRPGASGPAVIVAHVDTKFGPDVFYRLRDLRAGDTVEVTYSQGAVVRFAVQRSEEHGKSALPVARIWNQTTEPVLRMITCAGEFDRASGHYVDNLIVYASLAG